MKEGHHAADSRRYNGVLYVQRPTWRGRGNAGRPWHELRPGFNYRGDQIWY